MSLAWKSGWPPAVATIHGCDLVLGSLVNALRRALRAGDGDRATIYRARIDGMLDQRLDLAVLEMQRIVEGPQTPWLPGQGRVTGRVGAS